MSRRSYTNVFKSNAVSLAEDIVWDDEDNLPLTSIMNDKQSDCDSDYEDISLLNCVDTICIFFLISLFLVFPFKFRFFENNFKQ